MHCLLGDVVRQRMRLPSPLLAVPVAGAEAIAAHRHHRVAVDAHVPPQLLGRVRLERRDGDGTDLAGEIVRMEPRARRAPVLGCELEVALARPHQQGSTLMISAR